MIRLSAFADEIDRDPVVQLDTLVPLGVRHVEFRSIFGVNVLDLTEGQHREYRELLESRGFALSAIGSPIGKIKVTEAFEPHLERFETALKVAEFYDAPRVRIFSFYMPPAEDPAAHRDEVIRRCAELARRAAERGVTLFLENEKVVYGDTAARVFDVLESVASPSLVHAFDPANYLEVGQPVDEAWSLLRAHVGHFHIKDYDPATGKNVPAGEGAGQIPRLIADAVAHGFDGFCVLEPHLIEAGQSHGFTGPSRFGDATRALRGALDAAGIPHG